jgi:hypothetical protein
MAGPQGIVINLSETAGDPRGHARKDLNGKRTPA